MCQVDSLLNIHLKSGFYPFDCGSFDFLLDLLLRARHAIALQIGIYFEIGFSVFAKIDRS